MTNADLLKLARRMRIANTQGFQPTEDANDTEAVIRWLWREHGIMIKVCFAEFHAVEDLTNVQSLIDTGPIDNWKAGVCELALKIIDDE